MLTGTLGACLVVAVLLGMQAQRQATRFRKERDENWQKWLAGETRTSALAARLTSIAAFARDRALTRHREGSQAYLDLQEVFRLTHI